MKTRIILLALYSCVASANALATDIQINDININLKGGVSASAMYFDNPGFLKRHDTYLLNDAFLELSPERREERREERRFYFYAGMGVLQKQNIDRIYAPLPPVDLEMHYGYLEVPTRAGRTIEIGQLITLLGNESSISYKNKHGLNGALHGAQPDFYPGIRFKGMLGDYHHYFELTNDSTIGDASWALGIAKQSATSHFSLSYFVAIDERSMIDLVYSNKLDNFHWGFNLDYHKLDDPAPGQEENATGIAIYASLRQQQWDWPVRIEYLKDTNTGIYDYDSGYTLTFSPTYYFSDEQFVRSDFVTASSDGAPFRNDNGGLEKDQYIVALQFGMTF